MGPEVRTYCPYSVCRKVRCKYGRRSSRVPEELFRRTELRFGYRHRPLTCQHFVGLVDNPMSLTFPKFGPFFGGAGPWPAPGASPGFSIFSRLSTSMATGRAQTKHLTTKTKWHWVANLRPIGNRPNSRSPITT